MRVFSHRVWSWLGMSFGLLGKLSDYTSELRSELLSYFGNGYSSTVIVRQQLFKSTISFAPSWLKAASMDDLH